MLSTASEELPPHAETATVAANTKAMRLVRLVACDKNFHFIWRKRTGVNAFDFAFRVEQ